MKQLLTILFFSLLILVGCTSRSQKPTLAVTIEPQQWLLEQIVGDKYNVTSLLSAGANPENFDPPMSSILGAERADAFFYIGMEGFESTLRDRLAGNGPKQFDCAKGIELITGTHCHHHGDHAHHGHSHDVDPHVWNSVANARIMARNMLDAMLQIDPQNADYYSSRHATLDARLDSLNQAFIAALEPRRGQAFLIWHPSLSYFARDYGLEQIAIGADNKELSAGQLKEKVDQARSHGATIFFIQPEYDGSRSENIVRQTDTKAVAFNPLNGDWLAEMQHIVNAIVQNQPE